MGFDLLLIAGGIGALAFGGHFLVKGASSLALLLKMTPALIGVTVVAAGTSLPELFVGVSASLQSQPDLVLGNVLGSNLLNIALVLGLGALILPVEINKQNIQIEWPVMMGMGLLAFFFGLNLEFSRLEGSILLFSSVLAVFLFIRFGNPEELGLTSSSEQKEIMEIEREVKKAPIKKTIAKTTAWILIGFFVLQFGADIFVQGASSFAIKLGVSERIIGLTIVALGTSLPELAVTLMATLKGRSDVAMGNILGSNIFNIGAVLGISAMVQPVNFSKPLLTFDFPWFFGVAVLILFASIKTPRLTRVRGALVLSSYGIYLWSLLAWP